AVAVPAGRGPAGGAAPPADEADQGGQGAAVGGQAAPLGDEAPAAGPGRAGRLMRVATFNVKHGENGHGGVDLRRLACGGAALSVAATHLSFRKGEGAPQLDVLLGALAERDGPRLLMGDLNIGPDIVAPALTAAGYTVAPTEATFPAAAPRTRIDFVAVS